MNKKKKERLPAGHKTVYHDKNDRANDMMKNNVTNKIGYRPSAPTGPEIADYADNRSGVGTPEQSKNRVWQPIV